MTRTTGTVSDFAVLEEGCPFRDLFPQRVSESQPQAHLPELNSLLKARHLGLYIHIISLCKVSYNLTLPG